MKGRQIIFSPTGGTKKVADLLAGEWNLKREAVDLTDPSVDFGSIPWKRRADAYCGAVLWRTCSSACSKTVPSDQRKWGKVCDCLCVRQQSL